MHAVAMSMNAQKNNHSTHIKVITIVKMVEIITMVTKLTITIEKVITVIIMITLTATSTTLHISAMLVVCDCRLPKGKSQVTV